MKDNENISLDNSNNDEDESLTLMYEKLKENNLLNIDNSDELNTTVIDNENQQLPNILINNDNPLDSDDNSINNSDNSINNNENPYNNSDDNSFNNENISSKNNKPSVDNNQLIKNASFKNSIKKPTNLNIIIYPNNQFNLSDNESISPNTPIKMPQSLSDFTDITNDIQLRAEKLLQKLQNNNMWMDTPTSKPDSVSDKFDSYSITSDSSLTRLDNNYFYVSPPHSLFSSEVSSPISPFKTTKTDYVINLPKTEDGKLIPISLIKSNDKESTPTSIKSNDNKESTPISTKSEKESTPINNDNNQTIKEINTPNPNSNPKSIISSEISIINKEKPNNKYISNKIESLIYTDDNIAISDVKSLLNESKQYENDPTISSLSKHLKNCLDTYTSL